MLKWKKGPDNKEERKIMDSKVHNSYVCSYSTGICSSLNAVISLFDDNVNISKLRNKWNINMLYWINTTKSLFYSKSTF